MAPQLSSFIGSKEYHECQKQWMPKKIVSIVKSSKSQGSWHHDVSNKWMLVQNFHAQMYEVLNLANFKAVQFLGLTVPTDYNWAGLWYHREW